MATTHIAPVTSWKPENDGDMYQVYKSRASPKPRQPSASPRYVRTWSPEEEAYLLEARRARIPYKDIAARLNKTDLACRLHYHQMVVARKNSVSDERSSPIPTESYTPPVQYHVRSESLPPLSSTITQQTMLLPAPVIRDATRCGSGSAMLSSGHRRTTSQPYTPGRSYTFSPPLSSGIQKRASYGANRNNLSIDLNRIQQLYKELAPDLWSNIAAAYSQDQNLTPGDLENAFFAGQGVNRSQPMSPTSSSIRSSSPTSWPSAISTASTMTSQASDDGEESQFAPANKTRCSVNAILNN